MTGQRDPDLWDIDDIAAYLGTTRNAVWNAIARAGAGLPRTGARFPLPPDVPAGANRRGAKWRAERIREYAAARPGPGRWAATR
jgi:hypothetical protein